MRVFQIALRIHNAYSTQMILLVGALFGFLSVAFGAYSEHGLRPIVSEEEFRMLMTAIRYNQVNALIICVIGLALLNQNGFPQSSILKWSGILFIVGTMLFCFSIYLSVGLQIPGLVYLTPIGGITLMISWLVLAVAAFKAMKSKKEST